MKAWRLIQYGNFDEGIKLLDMPKPTPAPDEVLIEVHAASINPVDYKFAEGQLRPFYKQQMPAGLGFDCSGIVSEIGANVTHLIPGDEVFCTTPTDSPGVLQEYVSVKASVVRKKPSNLSFEEAAALAMVGLTTLTCMEAVNLQAGQKVLIHAGSGGIGSFAIQYASKMGAEVYTTTSTKNVGWVKALGANKVIDYKKENYLTEVPKLDVVYDTLGGDYTLEAFQLLKRGGKVVSIAGRRLDDKTARQYGLNWLFRMYMKLQLRPVNKLCKKYDAQYHYVLNEPDGDRLSNLSSFIEQNDIRAIINKRYPFHEVVQAFKMLQSGRSKGKNVIRVKGSGSVLP